MYCYFTPLVKAITTWSLRWLYCPTRRLMISAVLSRSIHEGYHDLSFEMNTMSSVQACDNDGATSTHRWKISRPHPWDSHYIPRVGFLVTVVLSSTPARTKKRVLSNLEFIIVHLCRTKNAQATMHTRGYRTPCNAPPNAPKSLQTLNYIAWARNCLQIAWLARKHLSGA